METGKTGDPQQNISKSTIQSNRQHRQINKNVKVKFALEQAMKAHRASRDIALLFL